MEKLKMHTPDLAEENYRKLAALFPNAVTETIDDDGNVVRAIDKDVLMQEINAQVVDDGQERYQFTWPDKKKSVILANAPIAKTLRFEQGKSVGRDGTPGGTDSENIYIEGDNLDALKLLQETYLGKVNMIYIDPPYNTGNDFIYEDDYSESVQKYANTSGQTDEEGNQLVQNSESNGRFHTDWLNMIYPRLKIAKDLISDDGVIFISIDDNELANLIRCCSEIFGSNNFIATIIVASNSAKNNSKFVSITHEYLICIAKNKEKTPSGWAVEKTNSESFINVSQQLVKSGMSEKEIHSELLALVKYPKYYEFDHYTYVDSRGPFRASDLTAPGSKAKYDIIHPVTHKPCKTGTRGWAYSESEMEKLIENDYILFGDDEKVMPQLKNYLFENNKSLPKSVLFFDSQSSTRWMKSQGFGFDFPKSIDFMKYVISMFPKKDIQVLDFFSGSATTAHAVMQLNAEDGGHRKCILIQLPEQTDEKSEAYKAGYKTICDIGEERIRRAGKKIKEETGADIDYGFRCFKVDSSNMKDVYYRPAEVKQDQISIFEDNIKSGRTPEDLLIQVMLDLGVLLSSKIEETEIAEKKVFSVADGYLIACFDQNVTEDVVTEIAKQHPFYAVFRDSSMSNDSVAANFEQIFETYSPQTVRKVL
ncbi:site-specific DNA-methyltransferase [Eubacterium pyruvativorans]|uniref:site-specific DNA-methyltransferase n=1 Tax=Eubacterium pyruvativorans TaxID=155865 RepID=UPI003F89F747